MRQLVKLSLVKTLTEEEREKKLSSLLCHSYSHHRVSSPEGRHDLRGIPKGQAFVARCATGRELYPVEKTGHGNPIREIDLDRQLRVAMSC
jgi:hypothetical protein